jgi:hypothetical protein
MEQVDSFIKGRYEKSPEILAKSKNPYHEPLKVGKVSLSPKHKIKPRVRTSMKSDLLSKLFEAQKYKTILKEMELKKEDRVNLFESLPETAQNSMTDDYALSPKIKIYHDVLVEKL